MSDAQTQTAVQREALAYIMLLHGREQYCRFRTFDDIPQRKRSDLTKNLSGQYTDVEPTLLELNAKGAGVFLVVNAGGHTDDAITTVRAVFVDTDGAPLDPIMAGPTSHCIVETSPGKYHVYWLVTEEFPLNQFKPVQQGLAAKYGCDPSVCNLSRVMRVPGYLHNKSDPYLANVIRLSGSLPRYSYEQILREFNLQLENRRASLTPNLPHANRASLLDALYSNPYSLADVEMMLRSVDPWCSYLEWRDIMFVLAQEYGETGRDLAVKWSSGSLWPGVSR